MFPKQIFPSKFFPDLWFPAGGTTPPIASDADAICFDLAVARCKGGTPAWFVIGDSLAFTADNVSLEIAGDLLPGASVVFRLSDYETQSVVLSGSMTLYDSGTASFAAAIVGASLEVYDPQSNPDGIVPKRKYVLKVSASSGDITTSQSLLMVALLDPPDFNP